MTRLAGAIVMLLFSIGIAYAQATEGGPANPGAATCVYAGEAYSEGATICITDINSLTCDKDGKWSKEATNIDPSHCGPGLNRSDKDDNEEDHMMHEDHRMHD